MRRYRGVADETRFVVGVEKAQTQVVVAAIAGQHEGRVGVVQFAGDSLHLGVGKDFGAENDACRVARKQGLGKGIDLENGDLTRHFGGGSCSGKRLAI